MPRKLIMCGDHPVLAFEYDPESGRACSSGEVLDHDRLPLEFTTHGKSALYAKRIDEWWRSRAIPSTRDGIRRVLESLGASSTGELLDRTYGLSLSDQYWVRREDDPVEWKDINFFDNPFDEALGEILLTSYSSSHDISLNAPDVSTGGDLPKRWTIDRATGRRLLVKSGRTGQEPMNEVIASKLCVRLGVPAVPYSPARSGNRLVCTCEDMLTSHEELVSAWQVLQSVKTTNGLNSHDQWIHAAVGFGVGEREIRDATDDWLVADYLMRNTDRHYNNFGLIRNIETLEVRPAPIYDTGASLWSGELDVDGRDWFAKPSFTLFTSVFAMLAALPFNSASYAVVATRRRSLSAAQSALASAMRRSSCVLQAMPPAASSASAATVMTTILPRCGFFFSAGPVGSSMVSSSMAFSFSVICSPCP